MTEAKEINVKSAELAEVRRILRQHLPGCEVRAFGSRVTGQAKPWSDLDLAVVGPTTIHWNDLGKLTEAFQESDLPFQGGGDGLAFRIGGVSGSHCKEIRSGAVDRSRRYCPLKAWQWKASRPEVPSCYGRSRGPTNQLAILSLLSNRVLRQDFGPFGRLGAPLGKTTATTLAPELTIQKSIALTHLPATSSNPGYCLVSPCSL